MVHFSLLFLIFWALYFIPSIVAYRRGHPQLPLIIGVNLVFGWTVLGWIAVLAWSLMSADIPKPPTIEQASGPVVPKG
jgi:hypothetical protein